MSIPGVFINRDCVQISVSQVAKRMLMFVMSSLQYCSRNHATIVPEFAALHFPKITLFFPWFTRVNLNYHCDLQNYCRLQVCLLAWFRYFDLKVVKS